MSEIFVPPQIEPALHCVELEPMPLNKILILGAGRGTGREIARRFALAGNEVVIGTRSLAKFENFKSDLEASIEGLEPNKRDGVPEPTVFLADTTDRGQVKEAYAGLNLKPGEKINFFQLSAGGFDKLLYSLGRSIATLQRAHRQGLVTVEMLEEATRVMYDFVRNGEVERGVGVKERVFNIAEDVNYRAPLELMDQLIEDGYIGEGSRVATLSSHISDETDPDNIDAFRGPQLYLPIGWTKTKAVQEIREKTNKVGAIHVDGVAPAIVETETAVVFTGDLELRARNKPIFGLVEIIEGAIAKLSPQERAARGLELPLPFPTVTQADVANGLYQALREARKSCTVYIEADGKISHSRPEAWEKYPAIPFL